MSSNYSEIKNYFFIFFNRLWGLRIVTNVTIIIILTLIKQKTFSGKRFGHIWGPSSVPISNPTYYLRTKHMQFLFYFIFFIFFFLLNFIYI